MDAQSKTENFALLREIADQRNAGGLTAAAVMAWHERLRAHTHGALDDAQQTNAELRELRRYLCTMAIDAGMISLAVTLRDLSCPPDLCDPPLMDHPPASDDERARWLNLRAMVFDLMGALYAARDAFAEAGEDYARHTHPEAARFAVITNAVQSAFELGEVRRGHRLLAQAERIAQAFQDDDEVALNLALARLYPPLAAGDSADFGTALQHAMAMVQKLQPAFAPAIQRFAAMAYLHLNDAASAAQILPPASSPTNPELIADCLVRLQVQLAQGRLDPALAMQTTGLFALPAAQTHDWALCGVLAQCLFSLGKIGPAVLMATLFLRSLDSAIETLPQQRGVSMHQRRSILAVFDQLQHVLVAANFLRAAEEIAALHQILLHGCVMPKDAYKDWAPSPNFAKMADQARVLLGETRAAQKPAAEWVDFLANTQQTLTPPPLSAPAQPGHLQMTFFMQDERLMRLVQGPQVLRLDPIEMALSDVTGHVQGLLRAMRRGMDGRANLRLLGDALFGPVSDLIEGCPDLDITPFGPVAALPFAALMLGNRPIGQDRNITIKLGLAPRATANHAPQTPIRIAFALGSEDNRLRTPIAEASEIAAIHGQNTGPMAEFNAAQLRSHLNAQPRLLHIAAHFRMKEDDLAASELIGSQGQAITLQSIFNRARDLSATELVFLSGCDSAGLSGPTSFAHQLIALGAGHVIAALWPVGDAAAHAISVATHRAIADGFAPEAALAKARGEMQRSAEFHAPHHWAAFQCYKA